MDRFQPRLNAVFTAERTTIVTAQYRGGFSGTVSLRVGDPPATLLGELTPVANSSFACVVRAGEQWTLASTGEPRRGGVLCWATPLDR